MLITVGASPGVSGTAIVLLQDPLARCGVGKPETRLLATIHDPEHSLAQDLRDELGKRFGDAVIPVTIRQDQKVREAASYGQPVTEYAPDSPGAEDYRSLGAWMLSGGARGEASEVEVKATELPLGARRKMARPLRPSTRGGDGRAEHLDPAPTETVGEPATGEGAARRTASAVAKATDEHLSRAEAKPAEPALETLSRVEDLARRAAALNERLKPATQAPSRLQTRLRSTNGSVRLVEEVHDTDRRAKSVARLFGARRHKGRVIFVQPIELGNEVRIAGDFNGWSATATPMLRNEALGVHELTIDAPALRMRYRLVVDGRWVEDQFNPLKEWNEFGDLNSVIEAE